VTGPESDATVPGAAGTDVPGVSVSGIEPVSAELVPARDRTPAHRDGEGLARLADPESRPALPPPRRDARVGLPPRDPDWMVNQLPVGMVQDDFFVRFVSIFQDVAATLLEDADNLEHIPDLTVTPTSMISLLGAWIGAEAVDASLPEDLQRSLLAKSGRAMSQRGTVEGIRQYLGMLSGGPVEVIDGGGIWPEGDAPPDVAWVRMQVQGTGHLSEDEFVRMVRHQVPAHVRAELFIGARRVLATAETAPPVEERP